MIMSDPRHVEKLVQLLNLGACNSKPVPVTKENLKETTANDKELNAQEAGIHRSGVGIVLYVAPDRADIRHPVCCERAYETHEDADREGDGDLTSDYTLSRRNEGLQRDDPDGD